MHLGKIMLRSQKALEGRPDDGLVEIEAGIPRAHKHKVACDPTPEDDSHAVICPLEGLSGNGRSKAAKLIAKKVKWLVFPKILREMGHAV